MEIPQGGSCPLFPGRLRIWNRQFLWRVKNRRTRRKTFGARTRTNNELSPHMTPGSGIKPGPKFWESSALATASSPFQFCTILFQPTRAIEKRTLYGVQGDVGPIDAVLCVIIVQRDDILQPTSKWNSCFSIVAE